MTDVTSLFLYLSLGLIILWTVRLARSKGRNPLVWGGVALLLMVIPSWPDLLGMGPMMALLFLKSPQVASQETVPETVTCPKCHAYHAAGHTYCVNCGWELGRAFSGNPRQRSEAIAAGQVEPAQSSTSEQVGPSVERPARHFTSGPVSPVFEPPNRPADSETVSPTVPEEVSASDAVLLETAPLDTAPLDTAPVETAPLDTATDLELEVPQPVVVRYPITPAGFTERGSAHMTEGEFQMAIDQFTKAIALDPVYRPAWERRAEAYALMGREGKANEDRLHLENLPGQAPG